MLSTNKIKLKCEKLSKKSHKINEKQYTKLMDLLKELNLSCNVIINYDSNGNETKIIQLANNTFETKKEETK